MQPDGRKWNERKNNPLDTRLGLKHFKLAKLQEKPLVRATAPGWPGAPSGSWAAKAPLSYTAFPSPLALHYTPSCPTRQELPHTMLLASSAALLEQNECFPELAWHCHAGSWEKGAWALRRARCIWEAAQEGWGEGRVNTIGFGIWQRILLFNHS